MKKIFLLFLLSLGFGFISFVPWTGRASAQPFPGGLPACQRALNGCNAEREACEADLGTCSADLGTCTTSLEACQACGNGVLDPGEECDIEELEGETCESVTMGSETEGTLACAPGCMFDTSGCLPRFEDNGNGTITDNGTGPMWEKKSDDGSIHDMDNAYTWSSSGTAPDGTAFTSFLATLNGGATGVGDCTSFDGNTVSGGFAGHCDWRLPTIAELRTILQAQFPDCTSSPCVDPVFNTGCTSGCTVTSCSCTAPLYWSATTFANPPNLAWVVFFSNGALGLSDTNLLLRFVRAVRGGR